MQKGTTTTTKSSYSPIAPKNIMSVVSMPDKKSRLNFYHWRPKLMLQVLPSNGY